MVVIVMGVIASGKTTIGQALAKNLGFRFYDADDYHSPDNIAKMQSGRPLDDHDRAGWLSALRAIIGDCLARNVSAVLACSALKQAYRFTLRAESRDVVFVYLKVGVEQLRARLRSRGPHFAGEELLASQLATLEEPSDALVPRLGCASLGTRSSSLGTGLKEPGMEFRAEVLVVDGNKPSDVLVREIRERLADSSRN